MKKFYYINVVILLLTGEINAQYPLAPEVWSIPKKIEVISDWAARSEGPSISFNGQELYIDAGGLAVTEWTDTGWAEPYGLNSNLNQHLASYPSILPNGKRLFFTWYVGGWYMYYSDWDSTINDWGPAINCGPNVNTPYVDGGCVLPNDTTLIFLRDTETHISYWDSKTQTWGPTEKWPTPTLWFQSDWGVYISPDFKKVYYEGARLDTTIGGEFYLNYDIVVKYADSTLPSGYGPHHILNFCLYADTQYFAGNYADRYEGFPTLTPDGKKIYFTATYNGQTTIYESDMLVDENGDTVTSVEDNYKPETIPQEIELYPAFPNPFNPNTKIRYKLIDSGDIAIAIYDVLGQKITELYNGEKAAGEYEIAINAEQLKLSSGTYIVVLKNKEQKLSQKIIYLK